MITWSFGGDITINPYKATIQNLSELHELRQITRGADPAFSPFRPCWQETQRKVKLPVSVNLHRPMESWGGFWSHLKSWIPKSPWVSIIRFGGTPPCILFPRHATPGGSGSGATMRAVRFVFCADARCVVVLSSFHWEDWSKSLEETMIFQTWSFPSRFLS